MAKKTPQEMQTRLDTLTSKLAGATKPKRQAVLRAKIKILTGRLELAQAKAA